MITFETQEDFQNAVIDIIKKTLRVDTGYECGERTLELSISRYWLETSEECPEIDDICFSHTDLPTPSIRY